jgi:chromosome segregation ATPase
LTEEKLRLQAQVIELERDVEELARSRDEARQAAVQEGSQYVEIVKKASRLEEIAGEERKSWKKQKEDMERKIEALKARSRETQGSLDPAEDSGPSSRPGEEKETDTPASSEGVVPVLKMELSNEPRQAMPISYPSGPSEAQESAEDLKTEIRRLRERCTEVEDALRTIRDDSRSMEDIIKTLLERADSTLRSPR